MRSSNPKDQFHQKCLALADFAPEDWGEISGILDRVSSDPDHPIHPPTDDVLGSFAQGAALLTFSFGIDGVSIEISKYARALSSFLSPEGIASIHLIAGTFDPEADSILDPAWPRLQVEGIDGWDKWDGGRWFDALFRRRMISRSEESKFLKKEIFRQAVVIADRLGGYFLDQKIGLVLPVNVASNPGNLALTLGLVLATEVLGTYVLNINHDYYWESGKPESERDPGERPGIRDHFFRNILNRSFFSLFESLYPWNGTRWLQVNINARQSRRLIDRFGFPKDRVFEISTYVGDSFFEPCGRKEQVQSRLRMAYILSGGEAIMHPVPFGDHLAGIDRWMQDQQPVIVGARSGLHIDPRSDDLIILLQPTRIVRRKRIERNFALIEALLRGGPLREEFEDNPGRQLVLHITGPAPMEHQADLERILRAYRKTIQSLPQSLADRIFVAFSVGQETHTSFASRGFEPLRMDAIYRMANAVVFPSETEGRGLPLIEASACGIPIICSRYRPREVFHAVIGEDLPEEDRIQHIRFPDIRFSKDFLLRVAAMLIHPHTSQEMILHNRAAVRARFSKESFQRSLQRLLVRLCSGD